MTRTTMLKYRLDSKICNTDFINCLCYHFLYNVKRGPVGNIHTIRGKISNIIHSWSRDQGKNTDTENIPELNSK